MTNEEKLRTQLAAVGLWPEVIYHAKGCDPVNCRCDVRAVVSLRVRANTRTGFRVSRHVCRVNPDAPVSPFTFPVVEGDGLPHTPKIEHR